MKKKINIFALSAYILCSLILFAYFAGIVSVNFSKIPFYYTTDMYSDMMYAGEVWEHKNIFPTGWVFGNQIYAIGTPVFAALFFGLTHDYCIAMALASTFNGIFVLLSFSWMLKPFMKELHYRLLACTALMTLMLASGDAFLQFHGWQLFFTMCSYYACYAIIAFLCFGCYIRSTYTWSRGLLAITIVSCFLSFGAGIQSLRQTAVMVCPLVAVEFIRMLFLYIKKQKLFTKSTLTAALFSVSNILGLLYVKFADIKQVTVFGGSALKPLSEVIPDISNSIHTAFSLLCPKHYNAVIPCAVILLITLFLIYRLIKTKNPSAVYCLLLFLVSVCVLFVIDIFTSMIVRDIYYFMLYPACALLVALLSKHFGKIAHIAALIALLILFVNNYNLKVSHLIFSPYKNDSLKEVCEYLDNNNINTVYSAWNCAERIAIESDFKIQAGFWGFDPLVCVKHLCNAEVFEAEPAESAYLFYTEDSMNKAMEIAQAAGTSLSLEAYFENSGIYLCTSDDNVMKICTEADK